MELSAMRNWFEVRLVQKGNLTLDDLAAELAEDHDLAIHRVSAWGFCAALA